MELKSQHKNTIRLVAALLHDRDLRLQLRQIQYGASPLHREYVNFLSNQKQGQDGSGINLGLSQWLGWGCDWAGFLPGYRGMARRAVSCGRRRGLRGMAGSAVS